MPVISSVGYAGDVDETDWARYAGKMGARYGLGEAGDLTPSISPTTARTVRFSGGTAVGCGIIDTVTTTDVQLPVVNSGSRWFLIVLRRVWGSTKASTITFINAPQVGETLPTRPMEPGIEDDQPLALAQVKAGDTQVQVIRDLRVWSTNGGTTAVHDLVRSYLTDLGTQVTIGSITYARVLDSQGAPTWLASDARGSIGERPSILTRRSEALGLNIPDPWIPSFNTIVERQSASVGMSRVGNSYANPARIRFDQDGLYAIGFSAEVLVTGGAVHFGLGVMAGAVEPASYLGSHTARSSTSPQRLSVGDTRWIRAGTEIGVSVQHTSFEMSVSLLGANFWATWLGN